MYIDMYLTYPRNYKTMDVYVPYLQTDFRHAPKRAGLVLGRQSFMSESFIYRSLRKGGNYSLNLNPAWAHMKMFLWAFLEILIKFFRVGLKCHTQSKQG